MICDVCNTTLGKGWCTACSAEADAISDASSAGTAKIVDLGQRRATIEQPDANCVKQDDWGRPLYLFAYEFDHEDGKNYGFDFWAYDLADAGAKLRSIRASARIIGQLYAKDIPA